MKYTVVVNQHCHEGHDHVSTVITTADNRDNAIAEAVAFTTAYADLGYSVDNQVIDLTEYEDVPGDMSSGYSIVSVTKDEASGENGTA